MIRRSIWILLTLAAFSSSVFAESIEVERLEDRLSRLKESIELTKKKLKSPQDIEYLPDFYFMLAELLVESSRVSISLKQAKFPKTPMEELDLTAERRPKLEAIEIYKQIEGRFPKYTKLDKVLFFMAHEHRELGQADEALALYKRLTEKFPESLHWDEAQLNIGNHYFEKKDFDFALQQYEKIAARPSSKAGSSAHYKIGWCHINKGNWLKALNAFEKSVAVHSQIEGQLTVSDLKNADMREEALVASVWPYTELKPEELRRLPKGSDPIAFYRALAPDRFTYGKVMGRLGRRLGIKKRFQEAALAHYEALRSMSDPEAQIGAIEDYYRAFKESKQTYFPAEFGRIVAENLRQLDQIERELPVSKRRSTRFEPLMRDVATSMHQTAMSTKRADDLLHTAQVYEEYLSLYPKGKHTRDMLINLAESYYHAGVKVNSARLYLKIARASQKTNRHKDYLSSSIQGFVEALSESERLTALEKFTGRAGFKLAANDFAKRYSTDKRMPDILFNLAKVYYDERQFAQATARLKSFLLKYPASPQSEQAALLYLDCFYQQEKLQDLVKAGREIASVGRMPASTKERIQQVVKEAQLKRVRSIAGDFNTKKYADKMLNLAKSKEGAGVAEPALYEAFLSLKSSGDPRVFEVGGAYVARFPQDEKAKAVLATLIQMALMATDFVRAATYLETYAMRFPNEPQSATFSDQAIEIYRSLGKYRDAFELAKRIGAGERALRILFDGQQWGLLATEAGRLAGAESMYLHGLALMNAGQRAQGEQMLARLAQDASQMPSDADAKGHVIFLAIAQLVEQFRASGRGQAVTPATIKEKVAQLGQIEAKTQLALSTGAGRWIVGSLGLLAQAQDEMVSYLKNAPPPAGMSAQQFQQIMSQQAQQFSANAKGFRDQCRELVTGKEIATKMYRYCRAGEPQAIDSMLDFAPPFREARTGPSGDLVTRLLKNPRSIEDLKKRFVQARGGQEYGVAELILNRLLEIEGSESQWAAELGWVFLEAKKYQQAGDQFQKAAVASAAADSAKWGQASLYLGLGLSEKFAQLKVGLKGARRPAGVKHPWLSEAMRR